MPSKDTQFTKENARDNQRKSVEKRNENTEKRRAMKELLMDELTKPVTEGSTMTKLEWLIAKAISNTKDDVNLQDLQRLQELLGEKTTNNNINFQSTKSAEDCAKDILKAIGE